LDDHYTFKAIGHVENPFDEPTSSEDLRAVESRIVIEPECLPGLTGMEAGQRLLVIFVFHRSKGFEWLQHPRGNRSQPKRGVFTLRSPKRPTPIGISEVELMSIEGNVLRVRGLDALNGTPVLDLKPAF
jgi:tRNA-Thr(GGU) m(6)t(6)A37 methyltransferase TsaA